MGKLLVFSKPASPDREADYNDWYDNVHIKEVCALEPFTGAQRFKVADSPFGAPDYQYVAIYEFKGDAKAATDALAAGLGTMTMSDAIDGGSAKIVAVEEHAPPHRP